MGQQIIKQPNGKFCIFSSIVDSVIGCDMEEQDIVNELIIELDNERDDRIIEIKNKVKKIISKLNEGDRPYFQFTMTYEEMLQKIKEIHGDEEAEKIRNEIEA